VSAHEPATLYAEYGRELAELLEHVLAGDLGTDCAAVERLVVRFLGALVWLQQHHRVDQRGRCSICRSPRRAWWPWPKRTTCTVYTALRFHLRQPDRFVLAAITDTTGMARGSP
jgi:hypothetical protein